MNWDDLRFFLSLYRHGSLSAAAKHLGVNHATVARRIDKLEAQLAARLFDRLALGYQPTDAAHEIYDYAQGLEQGVNQLERHLKGRDQGLSGPLRVAVPELAILDLSEVFLEFSRTYPSVELQIIPSIDHAAIEKLEVDVALRLTEKPPEDVVAKRLGTMEFVVAAEAGLLKRWCEGGDSSVPWLMVSGEGTRAWLNDIAPEAQVVMSSASQDYILAAARKGMGVAIVSRQRLESEPNLQALPQHHFRLNLDLWRLSHPDLRANEKLKVFNRFVEEALKGNL